MLQKIVWTVKERRFVYNGFTLKKRCLNSVRMVRKKDCFDYEKGRVFTVAKRCLNGVSTEAKTGCSNGKKEVFSIVALQ